MPERQTFPVQQPYRRPWDKGVLHPESYSLARRFDGVDDVVRLAIGACNLTGSFTVALLWRSLEEHIPDGLMVNHNAANQGKVLLLCVDSGLLEAPPGLTTTSADGVDYLTHPEMTIGFYNSWVIEVASKAAGSATPRYHVYKDGSWRHADGQGPLADPLTQTGGNIRIPSFGGLSFDPIDAAVAAQWNGTALSDGQVETLSTNRATSDWSALSPSGLWQFNQESTSTAVTDLTGNGADQVAITGTTVITTGPQGWTYSANPEVEFGVPSLVRHIPVAA